MASDKQKRKGSDHPAVPRSAVYVFALLGAAAILLYGLLFGHLAGNPNLIIGSLILLFLLIWAYADVRKLFGGLIFIIPILIGNSSYQINIGVFLRNILPIIDLYVDPFSLLSMFLVFLGIVEISKRLPLIAETPLSRILLISAAIALLTFGFSEYKQSGAVFFLYLMTGFVSYFLGYFLMGDRKGYLGLIAVMVASFAIPSFFAAYQLATGNYLYENDSTLGRITGTFPHSNTYGSFIFVILTVTLMAYLSISRPRKGKAPERGYGSWDIAAWVLMGYMLILLLLTFSRTAWIGFALSCLIAVAFRPKLRIPSVLLGSSGLAVLMAIGRFRDRIMGIFDHYMYDSMYGRREIWDMALFAAKKKPYLGYGIGSFEEVIKEVQGKETGNVYPHNDTIRFFLEGGLAGVFSYLLYMAGAIFYAAKSFLRYPKGIAKEKFLGSVWEIDFKLLGIIPLALFSIMVVISLVESPSMDFVYQIFAWTLLGSWLGMSEKYWKGHGANNQ